MRYLEKIWSWPKAQFQKPETHLVIGVVGGFLIGVGAGNMGLGIALAVALGVPVYLAGKKNKKAPKSNVNKGE